MYRFAKWSTFRYEISKLPTKTRPCKKQEVPISLPNSLRASDKKLPTKCKCPWNKIKINQRWAMGAWRNDFASHLFATGVEKSETPPLESNVATEKADDFHKTRMRQNKKRVCRPKRQFTKKRR